MDILYKKGFQIGNAKPFNKEIPSAIREKDDITRDTTPHHIYIWVYIYFGMWIFDWTSSPEFLPLVSAGGTFLSSGLTPGTWRSSRSCPSLPRLPRLLHRRPARPPLTPLPSPLRRLRLPCSSTPAPTLYPGTQPTTGNEATSLRLVHVWSLMMIII